MNFEHTEYMKFAIFEDCINHTQATSYYFSGYHAEIIAHTSHEFDAALKQIERYQADGFHLAGYVSYHAANAIYSKLMLKPSTTPLLHFMVFTQAQQFAAQDLMQLRPELSQDNPLLKFNYLELNSDYDGYQQKFEQVQQQLKSGNTYQLNLTTPINISIKRKVNPLNLYYQLSRSHPVTYAAYFLIIQRSCRFHLNYFSKTASTISVRPMKGTAPRGNTIQKIIKIGNFYKMTIKTVRKT